MMGKGIIKHTDWASGAVSCGIRTFFESAFCFKQTGVGQNQFRAQTGQSSVPLPAEIIYKNLEEIRDIFLFVCFTEQ